VTKPIAGHLAKAGVEAGEIIQEFRVTADTAAQYAAGATVPVAAVFAVGQKVDVQGTSIGKGFTGTIKRHNFKSQRASHGNSRSHNATWILGHRNRTGHVVRTAVTVRCALRFEVVTLDGAGEAFTDGSALHVHFLAHSKHGSHGHSSACGVLGGRVGGHAEFLNDFTGFNTGFGQVTSDRLGHARCLTGTKCHLQSDIAIVILGFEPVKSFKNSA